MKRLMSMDRAKSYGFTPTTELKDGIVKKSKFNMIFFINKIYKGLSQ